MQITCARQEARACEQLFELGVPLPLLSLLLRRERRVVVLLLDLCALVVTRGRLFLRRRRRRGAKLLLLLCGRKRRRAGGGLAQATVRGSVGDPQIAWKQSPKAHLCGGRLRLRRGCLTLLLFGPVIVCGRGSSWCDPGSILRHAKSSVSKRDARFGRLRCAHGS